MSFGDCGGGERADGHGHASVALPSGVFNPVVGSGAAYEITTSNGRKTNIEYTIVGKESVDGKDGFWMEWTTIRHGMGEMVMKVLIVRGTHLRAKGHHADGGPSADGNAVQMGRAWTVSSAPADIRNYAEDVGTSPSPRPPALFRASTTR